MKNVLTKCTNTLQLQIFMVVEYAFQNALQATFISSNKGLEPGMLNVVEQALDEVVLSHRAHMEREAEMLSIFQTKPVADTTVQSVLSNT